MVFQFDAGVAEVYERHLVPRLFEPWARTLVDRVPSREGEAVLDVACGTGAVALAAAMRVGARGRVTALDASAEMIGKAAARAEDPSRAKVAWTVSPAFPLAAGDGEFDVCYCQQGLQFFPDRAVALVAMRRALKAGGRLGVSVWAEGSPPFPCLLEALRETEPEVAAFAVAPWSWTDGDAIERSVRTAGFRNVSLATLVLPYGWEGGAAQVIEGLSGTPIAARLAELPAARRDAVLGAWRERLVALERDGEIRADSRSHLATAVR